MSPLRDIVSLYQLWREFQRLRPKLVECGTPKAGLLGGIAARLAGVYQTSTGAANPFQQVRGTAPRPRTAWKPGTRSEGGARGSAQAPVLIYRFSSASAS